MENFWDNLSKTDEYAFRICLKQNSQAEDVEKTKFIYKKSEKANIDRFDRAPWWRLADGEELAYLVAQRSFNLIENCDLPHPQSSHFRGRYPYGNSEAGLSLWDRVNNNKQDKESDLTKAQLSEALIRCQTRARETERLANQANEERERIHKLFLREASHLFAYKQWLQLLQLENLNFQNKINEYSNNDSGDSRHEPSSIMCRVDRKTMKKNPCRRKCIGKQNTCDYVSKFGVAFAIGFGLIGAGLLLGWTVGWFLPLF